MYSIQQSNSIPYEVQVGFIDNLLVSRRNPTAIIVCTASGKQTAFLMTSKMALLIIY